MTSISIAAIAIAMGSLGGLAGGLLGIGGGAVLVPMLLVLFLAMGIEGVSLMHLAVATSLASIVFTGIASTLTHHRRNSVDWPMVGRLAPGIALGALLAGWLGSWVNEIWLQRLFGAFLVYVGLRLLVPRREQAQPRPATGAVGTFSAAAGIGMFSALVGIGGGSLTVPLLRRLGRRMQLAVGTASACGVPLALAGTVGWMLPGWQTIQPWALGYVIVPIALLLGLGAIVGAVLGARLAHRLPAGVLQRVFAVVVMVIGVYLLTPLARW